MKITKRDGSSQQLSFDKIIYRLRKLSNDKSLGTLNSIDPDIIAQRVVSSIYDGVTSCELDEEAARIAISMIENPEYQNLASRIIISNMHKSTIECFSEVMENLYNNTDKNDNHSPVIADDIIEIIRKHKNVINFTINYSRDYLFDYFGYKTLEKSYLQKILNKKTGKMEVVERPQHLYMRVAVGIHKDNIDLIIKTYHLISQHYYTHASPTLFNAGTRLANLSSCFLMGTEDAIDGIYKTITDCAKISKLGGGIGIHISNIRSKGSVIRGTNGTSDGIIPMIKVYNSTCLYVNQCFTPDTWVYSKDGPKQMGDITTNDHLITIDGTFKKVNEVIKNNVSKEILEIRSTNTLFPVKVTKEHELYLLKDQKKITNYSVIKNRLQRGIIKPDFYNASELTENDLVGFPIPKYELDNDIHDLDYYKLYGIMLGDGHICNGRNEYGVTLGDEIKSDLKDFVKKYLTSKHIHYWECSDETACSSIRWSGSESLYLKRDMLYDLDNEKRIKEEFLHLPKNKILKILEGLLRTDGSNLKELAFTSSSKKLIMQMRYLFLRLGILTSGNIKNNIGKSHITKHGRTITTKKLSYYLRIPKHPNLSSIIKFKKDGEYFKYFEWNNILWGRIKTINKINYTGEVYDFNMIDNHNYLTDMGLVHNSGKRKGSFAIYLEPWHADVMEFLDLKKNQGHEDMRARDLFYAMWIPDLFMKAVESNGDWYLMCPDECPGLTDVHSEEFEKLYNKYVEEKRYKRVVKAHDVWTRILDSQIETGTPYIGYKDAVNRKCNQKNLGTIKSSNLCVAPETMILTSKGYYPISKLENQEVEVWNGQEFSKTIVRKTNTNQELLKVTLSNGSVLECTPYHKFYVVTGKRPSEYPKTIKVEARDLKTNMKLLKSDFPIIKKGSNDFPYPYEHGLFCADGTLEHNEERVRYGEERVGYGEERVCSDKSLDNSIYCGRHIKLYKQSEQENTNTSGICQAIIKPLPRITLYDEKKKLKEYISTRINICKEDSNSRLNCRLPVDIHEKFTVPINCNLDIKLRWLEGLCDGDGTACKSDNLTFIQISNINSEFLENVKYMLQTLGCDPKIVLASEEGFKLLPDHKGNQKEYYCKTVYRLLLTSHDTALLVELGFKPKRLILSGVYPKKNTKRWITVSNVEYTNRYDDTYCFKEEKRGMGIFNGVLTGQCLEISLYSDNGEYAVCNLASIALPKFVKYDSENKPYFDFDHLREVSEYILYPMNDVIDNNYYPTPETRISNMKNRPLGLGIQGLNFVYMLMRLPFESEEAKKLNKEIFETMYYGCLKGSIELAKRDGVYSSFKGSPFSEGKLQFDLAKEFDNINLDEYLSGRWDWKSLKDELKEYGTRNSMLLALMPTASTAQIMGNSESFEPVDSCIFKRRVLSGEYIVINKFLVQDLIDLGIWSKELKDTIIANDGSIQNIDLIPDDIKQIYKTVWEISMKSVIEQCRDRGVFVDQMQSMNLFMANPNYKRLTSMHFYAWKNNLKSGMYYLRSKSSASAGKFSIDPNLEKRIREKREKGEQLAKEEEEAVLACSLANREECEMCSS
jgi:ribonucleoside-diphosphate reductase alpha chain